jgi:hypothetical protein
MRSGFVLGAAAVLTLAAAMFQVVISLVPNWSGYFGAPEQLLAKPAFLIAAGVGVAAALVVAATYAASGAGYLRRLPLLRYVLLAIGTLFTVRGLLVVPLALEAMGMTHNLKRAPSGGLVSSVFALLLGILFLAGTLLRWRELCGHVASPSTGDAELPSGKV